MKRLFRIYGIFVVLDLKRMMEYKGDFLIGVISVFLQQAVNIIFLWVIFNQIPALDNWTIDQIIFIYGFSLLPKGLDHLLFDNLWIFGYSVVANGDFDKYLTRPINSLLHVLIEKFQLDALGEILIGILLLSASITQVGIDWNILNIALFIIVIPFATLIYTSIKIATAAIAFWTKRSGNITFMFYQINDFAKYPTTIYNRLIQNTITYIIPFAFTAFYPASYFLTGENPLFNIGGVILVSIVALIISVVIWNAGVSAYESAGS